ncbi:bifunctional homocysteine S-methyltransferase/methylenetetrahydrofolate reductase [Clostridium estertheticum]|uniref:Bifunctional homocysteine S-methyltransferase/methylenetetrahydrofolate reductase n=1 Tax=Clostridium estertheticum TaxID=238834 RepID=A0A5N7IS55_9CLOT|nr:bifunctional homocysteine S-methyltransferase/methylenetetrahydrofolate reductase [Clostridium estertheticum]MPQ33154.1 bifunctional homocysteine S-methyltransferase/methylenetetrahydrofolate reductase [Clostridium estertheticum]MPQ63812.1 bifunctional homocysteine S-methyltransferase/methylenetetrahydrofolate reductase [Clostridium estertheticum]
MNIKELPLIFDGAMGTYYANIKENPLSKCELANIYDRNTILNIHKEYIKAGCKAIKTNTFGANKISLESDFNGVKDVIVKGYEIASEATKGTDVLVFADIGPIPFLETLDLWEAYKEIVDLFLELGATHFIFETFSSDEYLPEISKYIKEKNPKAYILMELAVSPEGFTRIGISGEKFIEKVSNISSIDACGFNCFSGPYHLLKYIKTLNIKNKTISVMPNSGYPTVINNRTFFNNTKEYFARQMLEIAKQGVAIIGGCCGTTPEFIRETVANIEGLSPNEIVPSIKIEKIKFEKLIVENSLLEKIKLGKKIIAVELDPPMDTGIDFFMNSAKSLKEQGVDAITIADCPVARVRVDSSLLACKLKRELDITTVPHMTCRDRNINATKALLLGLSIEGVNNVLVVTGDPVPTAERDEVKAMFSFNSAILANYITNLNETTFSSPFNICGALNVNAINFSSQLEHAKKKIENGVTMFLTQPILSKQAVDNLKQARRELPAKILGGIIPIVSHRNACFMNNEISGITVSDEITELYNGISKEEATILAIKISTDIAREIYDYVDGYYLITPFKRIDIISEIIKNIGNIGNS